MRSWMWVWTPVAWANPYNLLALLGKFASLTRCVCIRMKAHRLQRNTMEALQGNFDLWLTTCDLWLVMYDLWRMTCDLWLLTCNLWLVTCDLWLVTCDFWLMTFDLLLVTCYLWLVTCDLWLMTCDLWLVTYDLWLVTFELCWQWIMIMTLSYANKIKVLYLTGEDNSGLMLYKITSLCIQL